MKNSKAESFFNFEDLLFNLFSSQALDRIRDRCFYRLEAYSDYCNQHN